VQVNLQSLAQVCGCTSEQVMQIISKVKEAVLQISSKKTASVNMSVGHLIFYPNSTYDFKTIGTLDLNQKFYGKRAIDEQRGTESQFSFQKDSKSKMHSLVKN